jgi:hypothetical protein
VQRSGTDEREAGEGAWFERQHAVVAQQDERLGRGPPQQRPVGGPVLRPLVGARRRAGAVEDAEPAEEAQQAACLVLEMGPLDPARGHGGGERRAEGAARAGHLEVEPGDGGLVRERHRPPGGHHDTVVAPLAAQDAGDEAGLVRHVVTVDAVVARHQGEHARSAHGVLEGQQVQLAKRALVDVGRRGVALVLGLVAHEVLDGGGDALPLHALDVGGGEHAREHGVLGEALEVASP